MKRSVGPFSLTAGNQPLARECWLFPAPGQEILTHSPNAQHPAFLLPLQPCPDPLAQQFMIFIWCP